MKKKEKSLVKQGRMTYRRVLTWVVCFCYLTVYVHRDCVEGNWYKHMKCFPVSIIKPQPISFRISSCLLCLLLITPVPFPPNGIYFGLMHSHLSLMFIIDGTNRAVIFIPVLGVRNIWLNHVKPFMDFCLLSPNVYFYSWFHPFFALLV